MFLDKEDIQINEKFLKKGYLISDIFNIDILTNIQNFFIKNIKESFKEINKKDNLDILNNIHNYLNIDNLNNFRLNLINKMSNYKDLRKN